MSRSLTDTPEPEEPEQQPLTMQDVMMVLTGLIYELEEANRKLDILTEQKTEL